MHKLTFIYLAVSLYLFSVRFFGRNPINLSLAIHTGIMTFLALRKRMASIQRTMIV